MTEEKYRTIVLPFKVQGEIADCILITAARWKAGVQRVLKHVQEDEDEEIFLKEDPEKFASKHYEIAYKTIPDKHYAESCCEQVYEIGKSLIKLKEYYRENLKKELNKSIKDISLHDWIMFKSRGDAIHHGNKNIRLLEIIDNYARVKLELLTQKGYFRSVEVLCKIPGSRRAEILQKVLELSNTVVKYVGKKWKKPVYGISYLGKVYIRHVWLEGQRLIGEVHLSIPEEVYFSTWSKIVDSNEEIKYVLGVDTNFDNLKAVLIRADDLTIVNKWYLDLTTYVTQGRSRQSARTVIARWAYGLFGYIERKYGNFLLATEDPDELGFYKLVWMVKGIRRSEIYNYKVMRFCPDYARLLLDIAERLGIPNTGVEAKGTTHSEEHDYVMKRFGLDRHYASAYIIAKRGLLKIAKHAKN